MAVAHDFQCLNDHFTERMVQGGQRFIRCPECGKRAERVFLSRQQRNAQAWSPVVYLEDVHGNKIIPPADDGEIRALMPDYVQKEARTFNEVRQLTKELQQQNQQKFYDYHQKRINTKRENADRQLEFAKRAREKMSVPLAQKITDYAISKLERQRNESLPIFKGEGYFEAFEN